MNIIIFREGRSVQDRVKKRELAIILFHNYCVGYGGELLMLLLRDKEESHASKR